jgi:hypothetical protein
MFVYGDYGNPNILRGRHNVTIPKEGTVWPVLTKVEEKDALGRFIDKQEVHLVMWQKNFLHAFCNMVQYILYYFNLNKDAHFILMFGLDFHEGDLEITHGKFILEMLNNKGVKYEIVKLKEEEINVNDAYYMKVIPFSSYVFSEVYDYCSSFIDRNNTPEKIVYLARSKVTPKSVVSISNGRDEDTLRIKSDLRIDDEDVLINYFKGRGFEIVYPENFKTFEEQAIFFNNVKTMICPSGSGMANLMFMQPGQTVVELQTPVLIGGNQQVHPFYVAFSWAKKHTYIAIPHERKSDIIIEYFNNKGFLNYL